jgi:putative colanic acid biosynthesis UDP-glucose lipid carrier transferase
MRYLVRSLYFIRISIDSCVLIFSYFLSKFLFGKQLVELINIFDLSLIILLVFGWFFIAKTNGLYDEFRSRLFSSELIGLIKTIFTFTIFNIVIAFVINIDNFLFRKFIVAFILVNSLLIIIARYFFRRVLVYYRLKGRNLRRMLIVGAGPVGQQFYNLIEKHPHFGYKLVGFLDDSTKPSINGKYLGKIDQLEMVLEKESVDDVIVALPNYASDKISDIIHTCENYTTRVRIIPDVFKFINSRFSIDLFELFPVISIKSEKIFEFQWRVVKRILDIVFSFLVILFVFSWLFPVVALLIKIDSKGPVFFTQERWGRNNKPFKAIKFRSMVCNSKDVDENGRYQQATKDDPRITRIGKILRKTNIDELPQFFNVLIGDMSVVGPRPHPIPLNLESKKVIKRYMQRTLVKPGITGWAQINGYRGETRDPILMQKRIDHDLWYIENWSIWLDIQIIIQTIVNMIKGDPNAY